MRIVFFVVFIMLFQAMFGQPAEPGNAIQFNGSSGFASVNQTAPLGSATLMAWVRPNVLNNPSSWFGNQGLMGYRGNFNFYILMLPSGRMEYRITLAGQTYTLTSTSAEAACVGGWSHVAFVFNQSEGTITGYFNGLVVASANVPSANIPQNNDPFRLGRQITAGNNFWFGGRMDNAAMFNRALTQQEVLDFAFQDIPVDEPDVVLHYKMNQSSGSVIEAETGPNASLSGGFTWVESDFAVALPEGSTAFVETPSDDGTMINDDPFHFIIHNATYNAEVGDDLIADDKAQVTNLPEGLDASLIVIDETTAVLSISGAAIANDVADSVTNADLRLLSGAFNEHCGWLGYPLSFTFIECLAADVVITTSAEAVCSGEAVTLTATGAANYTWTDGTEGDTLVLSPNETTTIGVEAADELGCTATPATITIEVFAPEALVISGADENAAICLGETITLTATGNFVSYLWNDGSQNADIVVDTPGVYNVVATDANGCEATSEAIEIGLFEVNTPEISWEGNLLLCPGASLTLEADEGFVTYLWTTGVGAPTLTVDAPGTYGVTVTDENGCTTSSALVEVMESTMGTATFTGETEVDENSEATYSIGGDTFSVVWEVTGGTIIAEDASGITVAWGAAGTGAVTYTLTNADGCVFGPFNEPIVINLVIGIEEERQQSPRVYPNPAREVLTLDVLDHLAGRPCYIFDARGTLVDTFFPTASPFPLSVSHLTGGMYIITPENRSWVVRFLRE